ncbi:SurA N-terminal domain-containing protein [Myxococcota bacterium]|nr:SurA N-terminal domain-containing protein [Myxococcota bacterium]
MSVLDKMRNSSDSFPVQALFAVVIASFVVWGVGGQGSTTAPVAEVDGQAITDVEFARAMRLATSRERQALDAEAQAALQQRVLTQLIQDMLVLEEAKRLGIEVSDDEIKRSIARIFKGDDGKYSKEQYETYLTRTGTSASSFERQLYEDMLRSKVMAIVAQGARVSEQEVKRRFIEQETRLTLVYTRIPAAAFYPAIDIPQAELDAFIASSADRIKTTYDAQFDRRFNDPRKATLRTILLRTDLPGVSKEDVKVRLEAVRAQLVAGGDFAEAARRWSEDLTAVNGGDLGVQADSQLDPAVTDAVFAVGAGQLTQIVETSRGYQLFLVEAVTDAKVTSLEEATPILAAELIKADRAPALAKTFSEELLAAWKAEGRPPLALIASKGLLPETAEDVTLTDPQVRGLGVAVELIADVKNVQAGAVLPEVYTIGEDLVIAQVTSRAEPTEAEVNAQAGTVRARMQAMARMELIQAWQTDLVAQADVVRYVQPGS